MADSLFSQLRSQLAANPKLRIGLALIFGIIGVYLILDKSEQVTKQQKEYRRLSVSLEQARQQATDTSWVNRNKVANDTLAELRQRDWTDNSYGLIQAKWNDALQILLTQEKAGNASVTLSESLAEPAVMSKNDDAANLIPGMTPMRAKLRFEVMPRSLYNILQILDTNRQSIVVDTLSYQWLGSVGRAEVNLRTFAHLTEPTQVTEPQGQTPAPVKGN